MAASIHPTAIIDRTARLGAGVAVGPYTVIEGDVEIGEGSEIGPHVMIGDGTRLGRQCRIFKGASVGLIPQDMKFKGEKTLLRVGDRTTVREFCTLNRGTAASGETVIGSDCLLLAYCHVAHDCVLGDHVIASNNLGLAGHVRVGSHVTIGGMVAVHQFTRIGDYAMVSAFSWVTQDVVPYALTGTDPVRLSDVNKVKLDRCGFSPERIQEIKRAFRIIFRERLKLQEAAARLQREFGGNEDVEKLIRFIEADSRQGILRMKGKE
jgi:UDP-N-acetylglucosamine acyltransferase